jgi:hypothetical protein
MIILRLSFFISYAMCWPNYRSAYNSERNMMKIMESGTNVDEYWLLTMLINRSFMLRTPRQESWPVS